MTWAFDPTNQTRRFAAGLAGVLFTVDGSNWIRLLDTRALPSRPLSLWFDPISDPEAATLFVASLGRGIVRLHPIPDRAPQHLQRIANGGFERMGNGWRLTSNTWLDTTVTKSGEMSAALGFDSASSGRMSQTFWVPCEAEDAAISLWWYMETDEGREPGDAMNAYVESEHGITRLMEATTALSPRDTWTRAEFELTGPGCGEMTIHFEAISNHDSPTIFFIDDVQLILPRE